MTSFVFWMLVASALGFVKALALATVMTRADFGDYSSRFYLATLAASLVSLGVLERTIKAYPRRWAEGNIGWIQLDADAAVRTLAIRFAWILAAVSAGAFVYGRYAGSSVNITAMIATAGLAMGSAWLVLLASIFRAVGSQGELQRFHLMRTGGALTLALIGGWQFGWPGALAGDVAASAVSIVWSRRRLRRIYRERPAIETPPAPAGDADALKETGHHELYIANLLSGSTMQADRSVVKGAAGAELAGTYGVVMMIPAIAQMLVNVIVQFIGPLIIKFAHAKHRDQSRISAIGLQATLLAVFSFGLAGAGVVAKRVPLLSPMFHKYAISDAALLLAGAIAASQIFSVMEFHLIARDRERDILTASTVSTILFFCLMGVVAWTTSKVEWFVAAGLAARVVQVSILQRAYRKMAQHEV